jgi:glycosyltransferase involved in cell wall biosynthesis
MVLSHLARCYRLHSNAAFVFVGGVNNQPMKDEMDCIIAETGNGDRVFFTGPRAEVPDIMQELDLYVFPRFTTHSVSPSSRR